MSTQPTVDYDSLAKQNGAISGPQVDYDALARQHGATSSESAHNSPDPNAAVISAYHPTWVDRLRDALPIVDRIQTGLSGPATSNLGALAKPLPGMSDERAVAPERLMTASEQQAHPIATGVGEFSGGMTTPGNLLMMGMSGGLGGIRGVAGKVIPRVASGVLSAQTLRGVYDEVPDFRAAIDRGDASEAQRIFTHIALGTAMAAFGIQHAATGQPSELGTSGVGQKTYDTYRQAGEQFSKLRNRGDTLNTISEGATGLYNSIRQSLLTHQEVLKDDGVKTIQAAIDADKGALMNSNRGSIPTAKVVAEAAKVLDATDYQMKPGERTLFSRIVNQPEMTLEEAKLMRTAVGRLAFGRSSVTPEAKAVFTTAYNELGEGMKGRIQELQGTTRPYEHYNNQLRASFELNQGIAGEMTENLQGQDRHAAIAKMSKFANANLSEIQEQMQKIGLAKESADLAKAQKYARSLLGAHDVANGKYMSGVYRLFMQNPKQAWPGIAVMMAAHGMGIPFPGPQIAGAMAAAGNIGLRARSEAGRIGQELKTNLPDEYFRTRTQAEAPETFTYNNPDEGWTPSPTSPSGDITPAEKAKQINRVRRIKR